ncbi:MAG: hypothetical protein A2284_01220 [Deltaproteobacteria bacterium RIFOXYA12_FULL_61_11]|nr:MAG: hypothetical protein A2284_01220 [Deltaproteobacteria bacterium RIFOXYA12_FULL_61_11]
MSRNLVAVVVLALMSQGCATIMSGKMKKVRIETEPPAAIEVRGTQYSTPAEFEAESTKDLELKILSPETPVKEKKLSTSVNGWWFGNLIFLNFFFIGGIVDLLSGYWAILSDSYFIDLTTGKVSYKRPKTSSGQTVAAAPATPPGGQAIGLSPTSPGGEPPVTPEQLANLPKTRLAVMKFRTSNKAAQEEGLGETISEMMNTVFINSNLFDVIERNQIEQVISEQKFSVTGMTDTQTAITLGKLLNVQYMLIGSIAKLGTVYEVDARIIETSRGIGLVAKQNSCKGAENLRGMITGLGGAMITDYYRKAKKPGT